MSLSEAILFESEKNNLKLLQDHNLDLNERDRFGGTPIIQAIIKRKYKVIEELVNQGCNLEAKDYMGATPLYWAAERNDIKACYFLLNCGASPNAYNAAGEPILVNPILRQELDVVDLFIEFGADKQFAQDYISAKLLGHRFELAGETDIVSPDGSFIPLSYEGFNYEFSTSLLQRSFHNFVHSIDGEKFAGYRRKTESILKVLANGAQLVKFKRQKDKTPYQQAIDSILNQDLILLPVAYEGHAITFVKYGNLVAKCDRGVGAAFDTVVIYEITKPFALDLNMCCRLLYQPCDKEFILETLPEELGLKFLTSLPIKHQITGNCSFANVEASVPAMMFLLQYDFEEHIGKRLSDLKKEVTTFSQSWKSWDQDLALDEAIEDFVAADFERQLSGALILGAILFQHCVPDEKETVKRAKKIFSILTCDNFKFVLEQYVRTFVNKKNRLQERTKKLFKLCGVDVKTLQMDKPCKYLQTNVHADLVKMTTALHVAALSGRVDLVEHLLINLGIDVDYLDRTGSSALMYASYRGHLEVVKLLIAHDANSQIKNLKGGTALKYAQYAKHNKVIDYLSSLDQE